MSVIGQSRISPEKNNCFTDETRDSILSKLLEGRANRKRIEILRREIHSYEDLVIDFEKKDRERALKEEMYENLLKINDSIITNKELMFKIERRKKVKNSILYGGGGLFLGYLIKSFL